MFRIKQLARDKKISISKISQKAEISYSYTHKVVNNQADNVGTEVLQRIAKTLGVPIWALFDGSPADTASIELDEAD